MEHLERLIDASRTLHGLGATSIKLTSNRAGATVEATFGAQAAEPKPANLTDEEIAAERERILLHSAG